MILRKCIRDTFWKSVVFTLLLQVHLILVVKFFPDFEREADTIKKLMPMEMFKKMVDQALARGYDSYLAFQHFAKAIATFGTFAAIFLANTAVAGEAEHKTAEFLLSRPYSRSRFLTTRYFTGIAALTIPIILVSPTAVPLARLIDEPVAFLPIVLESIHCSLFLILLYSFTFLLSTLSSDAMRVAFGTLGLSLGMFLLLIVKGASHFSIYKLADMAVLVDIIIKGTLPWHLEAIMAALSAILFTISLWRFNRRDF